MNRTRVLRILEAEEAFERREALARALAAKGVYIIGGVTTVPGPVEPEPDAVNDPGLHKTKAPPWFGGAPSS